MQWRRCFLPNVEVTRNLGLGHQVSHHPWKNDVRPIRLKRSTRKTGIVEVVEEVLMKM
jgi:hypothetical protein